MASRRVTAKIDWDGISKFTKDIDVAGKKIRLSFDQGKVKVQEFENKANGAAAKLKASFASLNKVIGPLGLGLGLTGAVFGVKRLLDNTIKYRDQVGKMAKATGLSVEFLSQMDFAAERSGSSIESLQASLNGLLGRMLDVKDGSIEGVRVFQQLGIQVLDNNGQLRTAESVFLEVAEAIKNMSNKTEAAALAQEIFGRSGIELIPLLESGKEGIQELQKEADKLGKTLDEKMTKEAEDAQDAITNFTTAMTALGQEIAAGSLPTITSFANKLAFIISALDRLKENKFFAFIESGFVPRGFEEWEQGIVAVEIALRELPKELEKLQKMMAKTGDEEFELPLPDDAQLENFQSSLDALTIGIERLGSIGPRLGEQAQQRKLEFIDINELTRKGFEHVHDLERAENQALSTAQNIASQFSNIAFQIQSASAAGQNFKSIVKGIATTLAFQGGLALLTGGISALIPGGSFLKGFKSVFGLAEGGRPRVGVPHFVGEKGIELFVPDRPGTVINNRDTQRIIERSVNNARTITLQINAPNLTNFNETYVKDSLLPIINRLVRDGHTLQASTLR